MSIKTRFLLSYIGVVVVAITLLITAGFLILFVITGDVSSVKSFYKNSYIQKPLTPIEESVFLDLKLLAKTDPNQLLEEDVLQKADVEGINIIVRKDEDIVYASPEFNNESFTKELPGFEVTNINTRDTIGIEDRFYTYVKFDFYFPDNSQGSLFVLRQVSTNAELAKELFPILFGLLFLLFILIIGILNYLVSRSIIRPISILKEGAEQIKLGNLDYKIKNTSNDEFGELAVTFEEMRTQLKASVDLQLQYEENRKDLLSNISHDLKTPITSIIGYVEGIKDGVANTPQKMEKYLTTVHTKARDMDKLIEELFLFSKLDLNKEIFFFETFSIYQYMQDYVEEIQFEVIQDAITIELQSIDPSVFVIADREKLKRVLTNLISNSIKYMDKTEKNIKISLSKTEDVILFELSDNGKGIQPSALPYIFDRFYREEQSRNSNTGGSGLGLAIAKQMIQGNGGEIWVTSELGKGTCVSFTLKRGEEK